MKMSVGATYTGRVCEIMSCEESKKCLHLQISPIDLDVMYSHLSNSRKSCSSLMNKRGGWDFLENVVGVLKFNLSSLPK